jgi:hypothetical protein
MMFAKPSHAGEMGADLANQVVKGMNAGKHWQSACVSIVSVI